MIQLNGAVSSVIAFGILLLLHSFSVCHLAVDLSPSLVYFSVQQTVLRWRAKTKHAGSRLMVAKTEINIVFINIIVTG